MTRAQATYGFAVTPSDEEAAREFYRRMFPASARVVELLEWRSRTPQASGGNSTFVARLEGQLVGAMNLVPFELRAGDRVFKAAWQQDSVVSEVMRGQGIGRELINRSAAAYDVVLAKGTSEAMYKLRKSCGFRDVVNSNYLVRVLSPVRFGTSSKHRAYALALGALSLLARRRQQTTLNTQPLDRFGIEFDELADASRGPREIRPIKPSAFLNWRYRECPGRNYKIIGSIGSEGLTGAVVVTQGHMSWIVDLLSDNSDATLIALIRASVKSCRANGAASIHTFATSEVARRCLRREGFVEVPRTPQFTYRAVPAVDQALQQNLDWLFWHGDGDFELYD
jgi:GNAT superfamily N-acetyltransferase